MTEEVVDLEGEELSVLRPENVALVEDEVDTEDEMEEDVEGEREVDAEKEELLLGMGVREEDRDIFPEKDRVEEKVPVVEREREGVGEDEGVIV